MIYQQKNTKNTKNNAQKKSDMKWVGGEFLQGQGNCLPYPLRQAPDNIIPNLQLRGLKLIMSSYQ